MTGHGGEPGPGHSAQHEAPLQEILGLELPVGLASPPSSCTTAWGSSSPISLSPTSPFTGVRPAPWSEGTPLFLAGVVPSKSPALPSLFSNLLPRTKMTRERTQQLSGSRGPPQGLGQVVSELWYTEP